jgi:hypothetical protein
MLDWGGDGVCVRHWLEQLPENGRMQQEKISCSP